MEAMKHQKTNENPSNLTSTVSSTSINTISSSTEHIFSDDIIVVNALARLIRDDRNLSFVQHIRSRFVRMFSFSPPDDGAAKTIEVIFS
jgi:hypothetical protein